MMVPNNQLNLQKCICKTCPSYNSCMKTEREGLFCSRGATNCVFSENGCMCGQCPVARDFELDGGYYCRPT